MLRKTIVAAVFALAAIAPAIGQEAVDHLGIGDPIAFGGTDYGLAWSSQPSPGYTKQEYLPEGAALESYESMVLVEFLATDLPISDVVAAQMAMIEQRKAADPIANFAVFENAEQGEILLDFVLSAKDANGEYIIEWNGYRYSAGEHEGQKGALLFAISERAYGNAASEEFLRGLRDFKTQRTTALTNAALPQPR
ncbi:MAG: hypothetical protein IR164_11410 [Devosia sp.]|jgi:hypothetical protein|uniref:hypothetical protein n=1 Tax=Devosia sp. TaxID=1871048 RepID=UPI001A06363A|nr:hypothetical protein [Devosia sp.]MBF0679532.1 hypothetical protein [Devosia sp.]